MNGIQRALLTAAAVLAGASPLLWVTAREYQLIADAEGRGLDRQALVERASNLAHGGSAGDLAELVRETRERHPDDEQLAKELSMILMKGAHAPRAAQPDVRRESSPDSP